MRLRKEVHTNEGSAKVHSKFKTKLRTQNMLERQPGSIMDSIKRILFLLYRYVESSEDSEC